MNKNIFIITMSLIFVMLGCSNPLTKVTPVTCKETQWERVGRCFARTNEPGYTKNYYPELCAKKNMPIDTVSFEKGYTEGRIEVCQSRKLAYFYVADFCRATASKSVQTAIDDGLTAKFIRARLADRRTSQTDVAEHDTPDNALVNTILAPSGYAVDGKGSVGPDKEALEAEIAKDEKDLAALDKKYYPMEGADVFDGRCNSMVKDTYMSGFGLAPSL